ncbi:MAG: hypothetical protein M3384_18585 [Acidobacteriota bacterium]|nr:hypothetical protein [Acidobacteriota bacterium]
MKKFTFITFVILSFIIGLAAAACSSGSNTTTGAGATNANQTTVSSTGNATNAANTTNAHKTDEDIPAAVKTALPDAQQFSKQHKDIPQNSIAEIEKETGAKITDKDHHSYLAFATVGGKRTQIGAATVVKAAGKDIVIVYESKNGMPTIREVRADGVPAEFLKQFAGKGHDDKFQVGADVKAGNGVDEAAAKTIAQAVRVDSMTMQTLYGAAHSH